jgi:hypothetical protein
MSRCSLVYVPSIETGRHVKNNACAVEIKIKWIKRKQMTHENTYRDDNFELQYFQKISNLFFGPFAADVEKLALVCFSFVLFFAESTRVV